MLSTTSEICSRKKFHFANNQITHVISISADIYNVKFHTDVGRSASSLEKKNKFHLNVLWALGLIRFEAS